MYLYYVVIPCGYFNELSHGLVSINVIECKYLNIKGTVSYMKNLQITLEIKKNKFQSLHVPFFLKISHDFDRKMIFYSVSTVRCFSP